MNVGSHQRFWVGSRRKNSTNNSARSLRTRLRGEKLEICCFSRLFALRHFPEPTNGSFVEATSGFGGFGHAPTTRQGSSTTRMTQAELRRRCVGAKCLASIRSDPTEKPADPT